MAGVNFSFTQSERESDHHTKAKAAHVQFANYDTDSPKSYHIADRTVTRRRSVKSETVQSHDTVCVERGSIVRGRSKTEKESDTSKWKLGPHGRQATIHS